MSEKIDYSKGVYDAKKLGTGRMFILGVQHMFAMFGATVLVPLLTGLSVSTTLLCAGLGTLLFHLVTKGKVNPLIGSAGVSAVPMAARVSQVEGRKANPTNFLLMHAMGPNVAGVIGSAVAAGFLLLLFGK